MSICQNMVSMELIHIQHQIKDSRHQIKDTHHQIKDFLHQTRDFNSQIKDFNNRATHLLNKDFHHKIKVILLPKITHHKPKLDINNILNNPWLVILLKIWQRGDLCHSIYKMLNNDY